MQNYSSPMTGFYRSQMNNIANGYNFMPQYQNTSQMTSQLPLNQFPCRAVSNIKEVEALILDNPSVPHVFTNFSNNEIYVKYIDNATGTAKVIPFVPRKEETIQTQEQFADIKIKDRIDNLEQDMKMLNNEIIKLKGGLNVEPTNDTNGNTKDVTKSNGRNSKNV